MAPSLEAEKDKRAYGLALDFLRNVDCRVTSEIISHHLSAPPRPNDIQSIFRRLIMSAKNAGMMGNVIGKIENDVHFKEILCDYNPSTIIKRYHGNPQELLDRIIIEKVKTRRTPLRITTKSIWPKYCRTIMEGASFLNHFSSPQDFHDFVSIFHDNPIALPALPLLLAKEIHGFGFALACDFLKEIGYQNYSKPDVYLKKILSELALSSSSDDLVVFRAVSRIAENTEKTAFAVDKLFWLIGSGKFGNNLEIGRHADDFLKHAKSRLE